MMPVEITRAHAESLRGLCDVQERIRRGPYGSGRRQPGKRSDADLLEIAQELGQCGRRQGLRRLQNVF